MTLRPDQIAATFPPGMIEEMARALAMNTDYAKWTCQGPEYADRAWRSYVSSAEAAVVAALQPGIW